MPELSHLWGSDLLVGVTGDLGLVANAPRGTQRVLRRLLTNPGDYIWQPDYGAGLASFIGQPSASAAGGAAIRGLIRGQIFKEASVARTPEPLIDIQFDATGSFYVHIRYADATSGDTQILSFPVTA